LQSQNTWRIVRLAALAIFTLVGASAFAGTTTLYNIDQKTGWQGCSACAGKGGSGPIATYSTTSGISSPSMDGNSRKFHLGGSTPYANALWWKQLGSNTGVRSFIYDLYYYIKNPSASQALEFDVNQSLNGKKYIFGTECVLKGSKVWYVYDPYNHAWKATSIACSLPKAYTWHHVVLEFKRQTDGQTGFVSVTIDGTKHYFSRAYAPRSSSASEINVAFQMDGNKYQTDYDVWLDKVKLIYW
jgi:hypothetical protein